MKNRVIPTNEKKMRFGQQIVLWHPETPVLTTEETLRAIHLLLPAVLVLKWCLRPA